MTHLLIWLLAFPLVAASCTYVYAAATDADLGRISAGYAMVYLIGTLLILALWYV
jgi:hypothetical protein